jgi:hypothetical protein
MVDEKGFFSIDWMGLPEDDRRLMLGLVKSLRLCFEGWREKWRRKQGGEDVPAMTVPWVNAAMVYGGAIQPLGVKHEVGGHYKLESMMPPVKLANLLVQTSYLLSLPENSEFWSRALLNFITDNEASAATHERARYAAQALEGNRWRGAL